LALLAHRLRTFKEESVRQRVAAAETVIQNMPGIRRPAQDAPFHSHWIFPVLSSDPEGLMEHLRRKGYDTTAKHASFVVFDPPGGYEEFYPEEAKRAMEQVLYLPAYGGLSQRELEDLGKAVVEFEAKQAEREEPKPEPLPHVEEMAK
jgi:dTDP-4-amino-4,6-dideoxygalactose transaminase